MSIRGPAGGGVGSGDCAGCPGCDVPDDVAAVPSLLPKTGGRQVEDGTGGVDDLAVDGVGSGFGTEGVGTGMVATGLDATTGAGDHGVEVAKGSGSSTVTVTSSGPRSGIGSRECSGSGLMVSVTVTGGSGRPGSVTVTGGSRSPGSVIVISSPGPVMVTGGIVSVR
jgi:hypothetical protein